MDIDLTCAVIFLRNLGRNTALRTKNTLKYKNMNLHEYYRSHKDAINSSITLDLHLGGGKIERINL